MVSSLAKRKLPSVTGRTQAEIHSACRNELYPFVLIEAPESQAPDGKLDLKNSRYRDKSLKNLSKEKVKLKTS